MAETIVASLLEKLGPLILQEVDFFGGVQTQMLSLRDELEWINSFLRDADGKRRQNKRVNIWVSQIRNLAFIAEDMLDLYVLEVTQQRQKNIGLRIMSYHKHFVTLNKLGNQLEDINRRIQKISADKSKYGIEAIESGETSSASWDDRFVQKVRRDTMEEEVDGVVGFEKDIAKLTTLLTEQDSPQLLVVSIVGMGGLGKTTLAKKVYNSYKVKKSFDYCAWIYVSQEYQIKDLLCLAISQLGKQDKQELEKKKEEELKNVFSQHLKEKKCLLVFDDVRKTQDWDTLKGAFLSHPHQKDARKQQRVLLTTQILEVAKHADPLNASVPYELKHLDENESFDLFKKKVFQFQVQNDQQRSIDNKDLEKIEKELVAKCDGIPLAIVTLGGLLSRKPQTASVWERTLENVKWHLNQGQQQCMAILALSYMDLPYYLKSCFLYFSVFPEDHEIESRKLIQLWVAGGFIQQRGHETMEDVAEEYLEELIDRSMIQAAKRRPDGSVKTCHIHDLLQDIAILEAKEEKLVEIYGSSTSNYSASTSLNSFRWLGIHSNNNNGMCVPSSSSILYHLHSLLDFTGGGVLLDKKMWKRFNLLRVVDLEGAENIRTLPKEIGGLVLLKYLSLKGTRIKRIPHSMENLCNLQTLDLSRTGLNDIPKEIWRMQQLRHLICQNLVVECMEKVVNKTSGQSGPSISRINNLKELQTLCLDTGIWIDALDKLTNLRQLEISYRSKGEELSMLQRKEALIVSLAKLKKLRVLSLHWCFPPNMFGLVSFSHHVHLRYIELEGKLEKIPDCNEFPPNLNELILRWSLLKEEDKPMATLEKLPNLKTLQLVGLAIQGKKMISSTGGFSKLQKLALIGLTYLEELQVQQGAFPCLTVLTLDWCVKLKMIPDGLHNVTTVQELHILYMPDEFMARIQKDTEGRPGEDWDKIKHISYVNIKY